MMKRGRAYLVLATLCAGLTVPSLTFGRQDESKVESDSKPPPAIPDTARLDTMTAHRVGGLKKLWDAMKSELDLRKEQEKAVDGLFRDHMRSLREGRNHRRPFGVSREDAKELKNLRDKLREAQKAGDKETTRELGRQLRGIKEARGTAVADTTTQFIEKLAEALNEDQRPAFRQLVKRLQIRNRPEVRAVALRRLWRATRHPDVGLSDEQRRTVQAALRKGFLSTAQAGRDANTPEEVMADVRAEVFKELTPEQRVKVEAMLEADKSRDRARNRPEATPDDRPPQPADDDPDSDDTQGGN